MQCKLLAILFLLCPALGVGHTLKYQFSYIASPIQSQNLCLNILMESQTDDMGHLNIFIPNHLINLSVKGEKDIQSIPNVATRTIEITQAPNKSVYLSSTSCYSNSDRELHYGIFESDLFYLQPAALCPYPSDGTKNKLWNITLDFTKMPSDMNFISSIKGNNKILTEQKILSKFGRTVVVGSLEPVRKINVNGQDIHYIFNEKIDFLKKDFIFKIEKVLKHQRDFFQDNDFPNYNIYLKLEQNHNKPKYFNGKHLGDLFTVTANLDKQNIPISMMMISHELFHAWLPLKMPLGAMPNSHMWFIEGITDYYGARFALESGVIKKSEYQHKINDMLVRYFASPLSKISNNEALKFYSEINHYNILVTRGHILGLILSQLESNKKNKNILDDIVLELFHVSKNNPVIEDHSLFLNTIFLKNLGEKLWSDIQKNIYAFNEVKNTFESINLAKYPNKKNKNTFQLVTKEIAVSAYQFDYDAFIKEKIIKDLRTISPEYKAGLREGMQVIDSDVVLNEERKKRTIIIQTSVGPTKIQFIPDAKIITMPQLVY